MSEVSYAGKKIVVTGAYSGIGEALLGLLRRFGADDITVLDIKAPEQTVERFIETDMGNPMAVDAAADAIGSGVDVLFNNAGIAATRPPEQVMRVNLLGLKRLTERVLPGMNPGGAVVTPASTAGNQWADHLPAIMELLGIGSWDEGVAWLHDHAEVVADGYFFSKQAVQVYTMLASRPAIRRGVRVNSICPSPVDTPLLADFRKTMTDAIIDWAIAEGAGRVATADDMARALVFLGSDLASYVNGVNLLVDGGFTAAMATGQAQLPGTAE